MQGHPVRSITISGLVAAALVVSLAACSGGSQPQGNAATYGPSSQNSTSYARPAPPPANPQQAYPQQAYPQQTRPPYPQAATPYAAQPSARPMPAPAYGGGSFRWHTNFSEAAAQARREGKMILVGSTQPGCSLCTKFKNTIVQSAAGQVSPLAVGYMVNALVNDPVWGVLKRNLPTARLMPLVGVITPDMQWLAGFGGPPDQQKLMQALSTARGRYRAAAAPQRAMPRVGGIRTTAQLNEYGEVEWTPTGTLFPNPEAASEEAPETTPLAAPAGEALAGEPDEAPTPKAPALPAPGASTEDWAVMALETVHDQIRAGELDAAKATLAAVPARVKEGPLAREVAKGAVAIYRASELARTEGPTSEAIRARARKSLRGSMWMDLFF